MKIRVKLELEEIKLTPLQKAVNNLHFFSADAKELGLENMYSIDAKVYLNDLSAVFNRLRELENK